jgi:hypothetical protein
MSGTDIMKKQEKQNKASYEFEIQKLTLVDLTTDKPFEKKRVLHRYQKDTNENKSLISFMKPNDIRGTALLSWNHDNKENDQWTYFPSLRITRRIAGGDKKKYFMGTDFTHSDLEAEILNDYKYTCLKVVKCGKKRKCYSVSAHPVSDAVMGRTGYSKRVLSVDMKKFVIRKVKYYDEKGTHLKTLRNSRFKKYGGPYRPKKSVMTRPKFHKTIIEVAERKMNKTIDDITFTERFMTKRMHLK